MTDGQARRLVAVATLIAAGVPETPTPTAHRAYVRWDLIQALRKLLEDAGIDWRSFR